ncbi:M20/M25/M40 family metallo-hydrolase [Robiginitalea sp.]|uniref:M20/M25/M40 family metallo-hydrolase n=1 Tax=Robiginitalea sp. TaxID=1902411 RepID=UPI003C740373
MKVLPVLFSLTLTCGIYAQETRETFDAAVDNWSEGDYLDALTSFKTILNGTDGEAYFERIALQTGELFEVKEVAPDGKNMKFSKDGKYIIFSKSTDEGTISKVIDLASNQEVFSVHGENLELAGDVRVFEKTDMNEAVQQAEQVRAEGMKTVTSWAEYYEVMDPYNEVINANTYMYTQKGNKKPRKLNLQGVIATQFVLSNDDRSLYLVGAQPERAHSSIYRYDLFSNQLSEVHSTNIEKPSLALGGDYLFFGNAEKKSSVGIYNLNTGQVAEVEGSLQDYSDTHILIEIEKEAEKALRVIENSDPGNTYEIISTAKRLEDAVLSPSGTKVAFSMMEQSDYDVYVSDLKGNITRVSQEIQHDRFPQFLDEDRLIAAKGEGRHRRSYMYDLTTGVVTKLFHNNTVRTFAPEYQWEIDPSGCKILIVSERDGNTISPERGIYLLDLNQKISKDSLLGRIDSNIQSEEYLRENGQRLYANIKAEVENIVANASEHRIYKYESELFKFGSKYISKPGNDLASQYIYDQFTSFGYNPELQWFTPNMETYNGKTANVIATLKGTRNPELVYVVSSHYDSVEDGPGADDNTSGTAALLEAARIMAKNPMPCTIMFLAFTGEEAGLLGSREFVRQAIENKVKIVGALNNDMVGWANNSRLDNTIRYSNEGIRDIQHAAASIFTDMITYDAFYYKNTDAHAYYEAYGDIVGGIGSYPVLGNPYYHQWNDNLETVNHQLVTEVAKTTAATLMLLASSPSRLTGAQVESQGKDTYAIRWDTSPELSISHYLVRYQIADGQWQTTESKDTTIILDGLKDDSTVCIKAVNEMGLEGWDWAKVAVD